MRLMEPLFNYITHFSCARSCIGGSTKDDERVLVNSDPDPLLLGGSVKNHNESSVYTIHTTKLTAPRADPHLQAAGERVKAAAEELEHLGIADKAGKRMRTDLPKDMREGADRDFGG
jgi:hypothetical protein